MQLSDSTGFEKQTTIYQKIFTLILMSSLFLFGLFFIIYYYISIQENEVRTRALGQFDKEVSSLLELGDQTNISNIVDMVYWDDFVNYIDSKDDHWFSENIISSVETYKADYLGIYDIDRSFINSAGTNKLSGKDIIPKQVFEVLDQKRLLKFYLHLPEGYVQVFASSVHPTKDIYIQKFRSPAGTFS